MGAAREKEVRADGERRRRLVVKIGSATLTTSESSIDYGFLDDLAAQLDAVRRSGWDVVVVARVRAAQSDYHQLEKSFLHLADKLGLLKKEGTP